MFSMLITAAHDIKLSIIMRYCKGLYLNSVKNTDCDVCRLVYIKKTTVFGGGFVLLPHI